MNLKDYYYPVSSEGYTKVYKYIDKNDATKIEYWKVISIPETNTLKTFSYDAECNLYNTFTEVIKKEGAELIAYSNFEVDSTGKRKEIKATVVDKDVYKWNEDNKYSYAVTYTRDYGHVHFKKTRTASGFETITIKGEEYEAAKFRDNYIFYFLDHYTRQKFYQDAYYVKSIGMIKYKRKIPIQDQLIELELHEILTNDEFEKLKRIKQKNKRKNP
ncbi:hypothetical protein C8N46_10845 [Kordia periserrulae]|uniref:Uncharacterized protein n=2 Tax=Kordia periserrulae TaxID=701523 RepID=A0A2T6BUJ0_9FLAO|nr:hypothetical protein C8N46_10845 [Kordia periserrulae]